MLDLSTPLGRLEKAALDLAASRPWADITLVDIADAAGVSVASVSKVLNNRGGVSDESRRRILGLAEQLGYQGNRSARSLQVNMTTAYLSSSSSVANPPQYPPTPPFSRKLPDAFKSEGHHRGAPLHSHSVM